MKAKEYEQKYKAALEWMQGMYGGLHGKTKEEAEHFFPELKESKYEWIRKMCMRYLDREYQHCSFADDKKNIEKCIAWLEKQGQTFTKKDVDDAYLKGISDTKNELEKQSKPKWTDEDEERLRSCIIELQGKGLMGGVDTMDSKWLKSLKQRIHDNSEKTCKNDTLYGLLRKMPSFITVDGIDYHFVLKKTSIYIAYYACYNGNGEEGRGNAIFGITAHSPIDLLAEMLEILKEKGLL